MPSPVARIGALRARTFYRTAAETYYQASDGRTWLVAHRWRSDMTIDAVDPGDVPGDACPVRYEAAEERMQHAADLLDPPNERPDDEADLAARDERVTRALRAAVRRHHDRAAELRREALEEEAAVRAIEDAVREQRWTDIESYLDDADTESLCSVSPAGLDLYEDNDD